MKQIVLDHVFKVFGNHPQQALDLAGQGKSKQEILSETGQSIGIFDASFTIGAGEVFVIMGLSGSGKSTLVRLLNRLIEPTSGRILIDGENISHYSEAQLRRLRRKDISMVFQSFALMPHMTVLDNAAFGLELAGVGKDERLRAAHEALGQVGLDGWGNSFPDELSGGMQQRVGLARALAADPSILLMDEAFSALDPIIRTEMQSEILRLQDIRRRTIVFISHDLNEAIRIADQIAIMKDGHVIQVGTPEEILRHPADDYVRAFVRGVDTTAIFRAGDIARKTQIVVIAESQHKGSRAALRILEEEDRDTAIVVNPHHQYLGMVSADSLRDVIRGHDNPVGLQHAFLPGVTAIPAQLPVSELFGQIASTTHALPVISDTGRYRGVISKTTLLKFLDRSNA